MTHDPDFSEETLLAEELRTMTAGPQAPRVFQTESLVARIEARIEQSIDTHEQHDLNTRKNEHPQPSGSRTRERLRDQMISPSLWRTVWRQPLAMMTILLATVALTLGGASLLRSSQQAPRHVATTYATARGERARVTLTDGTTILLNVASRLEVPDNFGRSHRTVRLTGEAYFQIAHATDAPFVVEAQHAHVQVLGTTFSVRAYRPLVQVAIRSGKVALNHTILTANDIAQMQSGGTIQVTHAQNLDAALGFATGQLVLTDVSLQEAIDELNRWYDADIRLSTPSLGTKRMHAVLTTGSIGDLMEVLRTVFDLRVVRDGRMLTLSPR